MSTRKAIVLITLCLTLLTLASGSGRIGLLIPKAHAITIDKVTLGGDISGWNFTDGPVNNPPISVGQGDNVSLIMGSDDVNHHFVFDADNDTRFTCPPDQCSRTIMYGYAPIQYSFTANFLPGNYKYYCSIHPLTMNGTFTIRPGHDVAVSKISVSRNFAYNGVNANPIQINVTSQNLGVFTETFTVSAWANATLIQSTTITLLSGGTRVVVLNWTNTQSFARGNYVLMANVTRVSGGTNFSNYVYGLFAVKFKGDVNGDCKVDIVDLSTVGAQFGKSTASTGFNSSADLNNDGVINIVDLVLVASAFGQAC